MISKAIALGLVGAGCVAAAAGGAYVAVRENASVQPTAITAPVTPAEPQAPKPVSETEAVVTPTAPAPVAEPAPVELASKPVERARPRRASSEPSQRAPRAAVPPPSPPAVAQERAAAPVEAPPTPPVVPESAPEPARPFDPPAEPQFEEVIIPASSVIGLQVTTSLSSERTQVEDRVEARVTRDVLSAGRVAIPAGSRVLGSVTLVERGGKLKERARLGVRFHTLILGDGSEHALRTEGIFRDGESPKNESARKIGGAAIGGAILGAIIGGGKGAVVGGATGAAGGTAAVMAGDRNAATLPSGTVVTVRLTAPLSVELRKDKEQ